VRSIGLRKISTAPGEDVVIEMLSPKTEVMLRYVLMAKGMSKANEAE
jgi:hypothetical protein